MAFLDPEPRRQCSLVAQELSGSTGRGCGRPTAELMAGEIDGKVKRYFPIFSEDSGKGYFRVLLFFYRYLRENGLTLKQEECWLTESCPS